MQLKSKSKNIVVITIILVAGILFIVNPMNTTIQTTASDYYTGIPLGDVNSLKTIHFTLNSWIGQFCSGEGFPFKEVFPDEKYVTSFITGGLSERIAIQGNVYRAGGSGGPSTYHYSVYIKESGAGSWKNILDAGTYDTTYLRVTGDTSTRNFYAVGECRTMAGLEIQLIGPHVGALKVNVETNWGVMATDYCYLISGDGKINIAGYSQTDVPMYQIGETVPIQVSADFSGPTVGETGRWQLWAYPNRNPSDMRLIKEWSYDYFREIYNWQLPPDAWIRGNTDSKWSIVLKNTLFPTDKVMINTIDVKANAPPTPSVTYTPLQPVLGDIMTITINGKTNSLTNETLTSYWVRGVYIIGNVQFLYKNVPVTGSDPFIATTTFKPTLAGKFKLQVWAHDSAGRESVKPFEVTIEVFPQGTIPPTIPTAGIIEWIIIILLAILIIGGIIFYIFQSRKPKKTGIKKSLFRRKK